MMVQNEHWNGQPRPASKLVLVPAVRFDESMRQERYRRAPDRRQVLHEVVERLQAALRGILQDDIEALLGLAGENGNSQLAREIEVDGGAVEHRQAAGDVKSAERDRNAGGAEGTRDVEGARVLVRLHSHEREQAEIAVAPEAPDQLADVDPGIGLVDEVDVDLDVGAQHLAPRAVEREAVDRGQRIGWDQRPPPADDVSVIVVVRRLDQDELKTALCHLSPPPNRRFQAEPCVKPIRRRIEFGLCGIRRDHSSCADP